MADSLRILGTIAWTVTHEGRVVRHGQVRNLVTRVGDQLYAERGAGIASPPALPTGMKLGTGDEPVTKTGTGAQIETYLTDSDQAFDGGSPSSALDGSARQIAYAATWAPGKATTATPITEIVIVNESLTDATSLAAATVARALVSIGTKAADFGLTVVWTHNLLGA